MSDAYGEWWCEECRSKCYSPTGWQAHIDGNHDGVDPRIPLHSCLNIRCRREFPSLREMVEHLETHYDGAFYTPSDLELVEHQADRYLEYGAYCWERGLEP